MVEGWLSCDYGCPVVDLVNQIAFAILDRSMFFLISLYLKQVTQLIFLHVLMLHDFVLFHQQFVVLFLDSFIISCKVNYHIFCWCMQRCTEQEDLVWLLGQLDWLLHLLVLLTLTILLKCLKRTW